MKKGNIAVVAVFAAIMALFLFAASSMPNFTNRGTVGAGFMPRVYLYLGITCAALIALTQSIKKEDRQVTSNLLVLKTSILFVAYALLLGYSGFIIGTFILMVIMMKLLGVKNWLLNIMVAGGFVAFVYYVFVKILSIPIIKSPFFGGVI